MKKTLLLTLSSFLFTAAFTQTTEIKGRVVDATTGAGLAYASITIFNRPQATYTNMDGSFSLKVPMITDTAYISCIGYPASTILLKDLNNTVVKLTKMAYSIDEVAIKAKRKRRKTMVINPVCHNPKYYNSFMGLWAQQGDTVIKKRIFHGGDYCHYVLVYVPYDTLYDRYKHIKDISFLQHLFGVNPDVDSYDKIASAIGVSDDWKLRIRIFKAEPNQQQTGLDARHNYHHGEDILLENVIVTKSNAFYTYDLDLETQTKLSAMSTMERLDYIKWHRVATTGDIKMNLEKFKITFPKTGIYYGIEYLDPAHSYGFYLCLDHSNENYFAWNFLHGSWHFDLFSDTPPSRGPATSSFWKPAISLTMSE
jgi:hypothetical protein